MRVYANGRYFDVENCEIHFVYTDNAWPAYVMFQTMIDGRIDSIKIPITEITCIAKI